MQGSQLWDVDKPGESLEREPGGTCRLVKARVHAPGLGVSSGWERKPLDPSAQGWRARGPGQHRGHLLSGTELTDWRGLVYWAPSHSESLISSPFSPLAKQESSYLQHKISIEMKSFQGTQTELTQETLHFSFLK